MTMKALVFAKVLYSVTRLIGDPSRVNEVLAAAETLLNSPKQVAPVIERIARDPDARRELDARHRITYDLEKLRKLPEGTLGRVFAEHMIAQGADASLFKRRPSDDRYSFYLAHIYDTHDIWHCVTGFKTDPWGELGLMAFYYRQHCSPTGAVLIAGGFLRVCFLERQSVDAMTDQIIRGLTMGRDAKVMFGFHWDEHWERPIEEVRAMVGIKFPENEKPSTQAA
jgi:ubiquinone biosynthesis protein Coq4